MVKRAFSFVFFVILMMNLACSSLQAKNNVEAYFGQYRISNVISIGESVFLKEQDIEKFKSEIFSINSARFSLLGRVSGSPEYQIRIYEPQKNNEGEVFREESSIDYGIKAGRKSITFIDVYHDGDILSSFEVTQTHELIVIDDNKVFILKRVPKEHQSLNK
jgi:hypothetical protein